PPTTSFIASLSYSYRALRPLHSFPTRRSSDLARRPPQIGPQGGGGDPGRPASLPHRDGGRDGGHRRCQPTHRDSLRGRHRLRRLDRKSTRLNSSHVKISYAVFCLKKKTKIHRS